MERHSKPTLSKSQPVSPRHQNQERVVSLQATLDGTLEKLRSVQDNL